MKKYKFQYRSKKKFSFLCTFKQMPLKSYSQKTTRILSILKFFVVAIIALFANFKCKCEKTVHFQTFFKK